MGSRIYKSMYFILFTGSFRLLSSTDFGSLMIQGYMIEFFFSVVPLFIIEGLTNYVAEELSVIQSITIIFKSLWLLLFILEFILMVIEISQVRSYQRKFIVGYVKPSEE